ncbi:MAG: DMT family transporter [Phycisphaerales bacterium]|nr:DMT family transporter [Phycisphaerales bacterium]
MPAPSAPPSRASGVWLVLLTLLSWAAVPLFLRQFRDDGVIDPYTANGWRYGISALFWLPYLLWLARKGGVPKALLLAAAVPVAFNLLGQTAFAWGPTLLEPGFFSFVFRVQIVFVTLGAYLLFPPERAVLRTVRYWLGVGLVALGSVGLFLFRDKVGTPGHAPQAHDATFWLGVAVAVSSGVFFAGYGLSVRYFVSKYSPVVAFGVICQFTAVGMTGVMLVLGREHGASAFGMSPFQWLLVALSAFIGIAISHVMYYASIKRIGVSVSSGILQLQPILTAVGSTFIFDERLTPLQWVSGLVGVGGAVLMLVAGAAAHTKKADTLRAEAEAQGS